MSSQTNPERDARESAAQEGLGEFMRTHRGHDGPQGLEMHKEGGRQTASCKSCGRMYVGPAYIWLNRGVTLTAAGLKIRELGEAVEPEDKARRFGWEAADRGLVRTPALDAQLRPMFAGHTVESGVGMQLLNAWLAGWDARMRPEQTIIGEREIGAPV